MRFHKKDNGPAEEHRSNIMRAVRAFLVVGLIALAGWTPSRAAERVDLLLVLAADISRSVDEVKFQLQRSGYAAAFSDPRVIEAIRSGPNGRIAVAFVEWSGPLSQRIVIDWMVISDDKTARLFGDHIVEASRAFADSTSISAGIDFAMTQLDQAPYEARRRAIDISGDGDNNSGRDVTAARENVTADRPNLGSAGRAARALSAKKEPRLTGREAEAPLAAAPAPGGWGLCGAAQED
jgi:hypothetical protein